MKTRTFALFYSSAETVANSENEQFKHWLRPLQFFKCTVVGMWLVTFGSIETSYRFKTYRTDACKTCPLRDQCTKLPKRIIQRSEYQDAVDINDNNIKDNPQYYKRRQAICEHPFGTIKSNGVIPTLY